MRPPEVRTPRSGQVIIAPVEPFPHQILVQGPATLNIPVFALAIEKGRYETEVRILTSFSAERAAVGRKAALALRAGDFGAFHLIYRRQRLARQSVVYSVWLAFEQRDNMDRFTRQHRASR